MNIFHNFYNQILEVLNNGVLGLSLSNLFIVLISILFALFLRGIIANIIVNRLKTIVKKTGNKVDDKLFEALIPPFKLLPIVVVFLTITLYFEANSTLGLYFQKINNTLATIFVFWLIHQSLILFSNFFQKLEGILSKALTQWILTSLRYLIIFLGIVAVLEVWGIKIGPVIAGLGLFGVAVALGAQDLFKNLISGIMILLEKRFQIGDVISVPGQTEGTVEHIGFRSTLIREFDSSPITIPNYIFAEAPIINFSNRNHRRIKWTLGLEYSTSIDQLKSITDALKSYISRNDKFIVNDNYKCFVRIEKFNDSSIDLLLICFTKTNNWDEYLKIKEDLALKVKTIVEIENSASFAFPSRTIYTTK